MILPLLAAGAIAALVVFGMKPKKTESSVKYAEPGQTWTYGIQSEKPFTDEQWRTSVNAITAGGDADVMGTGKTDGGIYTMTLRYKRRTALYPVGFSAGTIKVVFVERAPAWTTPITPVERMPA